MKKILIFLAYLIILSFTHSIIVNAQSGTLSGNGVDVPRLTTAQRNAIISPTKGQMIYNTDDNCFNIYQKNAWQKQCGFEVPFIDSWTQKANFGGVEHRFSVGFSIENKGYIGTGIRAGESLKDFWEYNLATDSWSQKADFGGEVRAYTVGFSIGNKGYIGMGYKDGNYLNDFWEYNPINNSWVQKANFGGNGRTDAVSFSIGLKGYIGTGYDGNGDLRNDFWEYDPTSLVNGTDTNGNPKGNWSQKANFGGSVRADAVGFSIGNKGYIGSGSGALNLTKDFWEYNPITDGWIQKADFWGGERWNAIGFSIGDKGYLGFGSGAIYFKDFWEYDPLNLANGTDTNGNPKGFWSQKADYTGGSSILSIGFSIGKKGYVGDLNSNFGFWEYGSHLIDFTTQGNNFNGANQLTKLDASGFLGVGVALPKAQLHLFNSLINRRIILWQGYSDNDHQFYGFGVNGGSLRYQVDDVTAAHVFYAGADANTSNELFRINGDGTACLNGNMVTTGASCTSDIRYKKDFTKIENSLNKVLIMNGLQCFWKTDDFKEKHFSKEKQIGFVAQEVEKLFPELVQTDEKGYKSVDYARLTPVLVEAMKELKKATIEQNAKIEKLEKENQRIAKLEMDIEAFKNQVLQNQNSENEAKFLKTTNENLVKTDK